MAYAPRGFAAALVLFGVLLLPHSTVSARETASAPVVRCYTSQLSASVVATSGAMGHIAAMFRLHNHSSRTCSLFGYPGMQLAGANGSALPTHVTWARGFFGTGPARLVVLTPGGNAYFAMEWAHIPTLNEACPVAHAVRVIPPNAYTSLRVSTSIDACGGRLTLTPVQGKRLFL